MHTVSCYVIKSDKGIRYLPWEPNCVTYMSLDADATRFFSGPLSGCSVFIYKTQSGEPYIFHANRNNSNSNDNGAIKKSMSETVVEGITESMALKHSVVFGGPVTGHEKLAGTYHDLAFVFGVKKSNKWKWYVSDVEFKDKDAKPPIISLPEVEQL